MAIGIGTHPEGARVIRVGILGCGKFATMFLAQIPTSPTIEVTAIADLEPERARRNLAAAGWPAERIDALAILPDAGEVIARDDVDLLVEATGDPLAGTRHALQAIRRGRHVVMVNVEADVLCGPALAERARRAGVVYSLAYGDQPALVCELVEWARICGFPVVAAGKGTKHRPVYHLSTPDTVWEHYGIPPERAAAAGMNPKMFNSFLDGTKSAIEMAAIANATGLDVPSNGLAFPPVGTDRLPLVLRPRPAGGVLESEGMVEVVSCVEPDGRPVPNDLRWGVYVVIRAPSTYTAACFRDYGMVTDPSGRYTALWRPYHLIGLELAVSIHRVALRGEPTGCPLGWRGDVVACAKRHLAAGEILDGEGGYRVFGRLVPASRSVRDRLLPIGFAHGIRLVRPVPAGSLLSRADVEPLPETEALELRREMMPDA